MLQPEANPCPLGIATLCASGPDPSVACPVLQEKEKAQLEAEAQKRVERRPLAGPEDELLEWPELELERVNSFLSSRLQEIKDSIRASFSVYDLNLDVDDFPKKAAVLEQKGLLAHLNGSADPPDIGLDLAPLSLGPVPGHEPGPRWGEHPGEATENGVVRRLSAVPSLSRMIWVQSPKAMDSGQESGGSGPEPKGPEPLELAPAGGKQRKSKRQSGPGRKGDGPAVLGGTAQLDGPGTKGQVLGAKHPSKPSTVCEPLRGSSVEPGEVGKGQGWGCGGPRPEERTSERKGRRGEGRAEQPEPVQLPPVAFGDRQTAQPPALASSPQPKGKSRKSRNKADKANPSIGECRALPARVASPLAWQGLRLCSHSCALGRPVHPLPGSSSLLGQCPCSLALPGLTLPWGGAAVWVLRLTWCCFAPADDVFLPKDVDGVEMDETDREVEYFKR